MAKKPAIGLGPISDDLARKLIKALSGAAGTKPKATASRIVAKVDKKNPQIRSAGKGKVTEVKSKADKLAKQMTKTTNYKKEKAYTSEMAKKHSDRMTASGRNWDGSKNPRLEKAVKANAKNRAQNADMAAKAVKKAAGDSATLASSRKMLNKYDIESNRGQGKVVRRGTGGRSDDVSPRRAAQGRSTAGALGSNMKKKFAKEQAEIKSLQDKISKAPADKKAALRRQLRAFREETGR
jgi:hypothetical protein